jgi:sRNA-binding carbon storage regulator CsrA
MEERVIIDVAGTRILITITKFDDKREQVTLGFDAPTFVTIDREEIWLRKYGP